MKKAPWIGISAACCSVLGAAVMGMMFDNYIVARLFIAWLVCSALICVGELIGDRIGKRIDRRSAGKIRAKRYCGNIGAAIVCAVMLAVMTVGICVALGGSTGSFMDFSGLAAFLWAHAIAPPVLIAVIADIISAVIKHKNRTVSSSSPQKRLAWLKLKPFMPPAIGLGVCVVLVVAVRLFIPLDIDVESVVLEIVFIASEVCLSIIVGTLLDRVFGVNFFANLLIFIARLRSVFGLTESMKIISGDTRLNLSYIEKTLIIYRVYIVLHIAVILGDILWYIFKLKRDGGVKPKKAL